MPFFGPGGYGGGYFGRLIPPDQYILDRVSGASAAYSPYKLRTDYNGPCVTVERSTDNAQMDFYFDEDGWLDEVALLDFVGSGAGVGGFVVTWYDQSGNERHLTNSAGSAMRIVYEGVVANHEGITGVQSFANKWMDMALEGITNSATGFSAFVACKAATTTQQNLFGISQNGADTDVLRVGMALNASGGVDFYASRTDGTPATLTAGTYTDGRHVHSVTYDPAVQTPKLFMDGLETGKSNEFDTQGATLPATNPDSGTVGAYIHYNTDSLVGRMFALILFDRVVHESERWAIEYDLGLTFDISVPEPESIYDSWDQFFFDPIPEGATLSPFQVDGDDAPGFDWPAERTGIDRCHYSYVLTTDPVEDVYQPLQWNNRTDEETFIPPVEGAALLTTTPFRHGLTIPDAFVGYTPNNPFIARILGGGGSFYANAIARPTAGGSIWAYLVSAGLAPNSHGGSRTAGGEILEEELYGNNEIEHALAIVVYPTKYLSKGAGGFVSPARQADGSYDVVDHADEYESSDSRLKMGSRYAVPADVTAASLGITSVVGRKLLRAMQNYGAYTVDSAGDWDSFYINATPEAAPLLIAVEAEIRLIMAAAELVVMPITHPLTELSGSLAGYSFARLLREDYTGPAFRVRRSSDNTETDIGFDENGDLDVAELLDFCGAGNGFIRQWHDQSENARHLFQTEWANQPQIVSSGALVTKNDLPSASFNGTSHHLTHASFIFANGNCTVAAVASGPATASRHLVAESSTSAENPIYSLMRKGNSPGNHLSYTLRNDAAAINPSTPAGSLTAWGSTQNLNLLVTTDSGTAITSWVNTKSNSSTNYTRAATSVNTLNVGCINVNGTLGNFFDGHLSELLISPALATADRQYVQDNQKAYYQAG